MVSHPWGVRFLKVTMASSLSATIYVSREVSVFLVSMASSISAAIYEPWGVYVDSQVSMSREVSGSWRCNYQPPSMRWLSADIREPGVTVSHLRLMSREVSGSWRWQWPAAYQPPSMWADYQPPSMWADYQPPSMRWLSAAIREVWSLELLQIISLCGWSRIDGSAAIYEPWAVRVPEGVTISSRPCGVEPWIIANYITMRMEPYQWISSRPWTMSRPCSWYQWPVAYQPPSMSREVSVFLKVTMASDLSATIYEVTISSHLWAIRVDGNSCCTWYCI